MLLDGFVLSMIIAFLRKGKFRRFRKVPLRNIELFAIPFLLQFAIFFGGKRGVPVFVRYGNLFYLASFVLLLLALSLNWKVWEFRVAAIGVFLNVMVIAFNGGRMPVSERGVEKSMLSTYAVSSIRSGENPQFVLMDEDTRLKPLADWLILPRPYPRPTVFSIGDLIITLAVVVLVQRVMCSRRHD